MYSRGNKSRTGPLPFAEPCLYGKSNYEMEHTDMNSTENPFRWMESLVVSKYLNCGCGKC
jgi:hypothetical protein